MCGIHQAAVDVTEAHQLQQRDQGQDQRQVADHGARDVVDQVERADPNVAERLVDHPVLRQDHFPAVDANQVAGEERHDEEKNSRPPGRNAHVEGQRIRAREGDDAGDDRRERGVANGFDVGAPEIFRRQDADPVVEGQVRFHLEVFDGPKGDDHHEDQRKDEKRHLPDQHRRGPGHGEEAKPFAPGSRRVLRAYVQGFTRIDLAPIEPKSVAIWPGPAEKRWAPAGLSGRRPGKEALQRALELRKCLVPFRKLLLFRQITDLDLAIVIHDVPLIQTML